MPIPSLRLLTEEALKADTVDAVDKPQVPNLRTLTEQAIRPVQTGNSLDNILNQPEPVEPQQPENPFESVANENPEQFQDIHKLVKDTGISIDAAKKVVQAKTAAGEPLLNTDYPKGDVLETGYKALMSGIGNIGKAAGTGLEIAGKATKIHPLEKTGEDISRTFDYINKTYYDFSKNIKEGGLSEKIKDPNYWVGNIANMAPGMISALIPGMGAGKLISTIATKIGVPAVKAMKLAKIGQAIGAGLVGGGLEGSSTYQEMISKGHSKEEAATAAALMMGGSALLNSISFGTMLRKLPKNVAGQATGRILSGATEAVTEWLEEPHEAISMEVAQKGIDALTIPETYQKALEAIKTGVDVAPPSFILGMLGANVTGDKTEQQESTTEPAGTTPPVDPQISKLETDIVNTTDPELKAILQGKLDALKPQSETVQPEPEQPEPEQPISQRIQDYQKQLEELKTSMAADAVKSPTAQEAFDTINKGLETLKAERQKLEREPVISPEQAKAQHEQDLQKTLDLQQAIARNDLAEAGKIAKEISESVTKRNQLVAPVEPVASPPEDRIAGPTPASAGQQPPSVEIESPKEAGASKQIDYVEPFKRATEEQKTRLQPLYGTKIKYVDGEEYELTGNNDLGVPYFSKVKNGITQSKQFVLEGYDRDWIEKQLKPDQPAEPSKMVEPTTGETQKQHTAETQITKHIVSAVRNAYLEGVSHSKIMKRYNVTEQTIDDVIHGKYERGKWNDESPAILAEYPDLAKQPTPEVTQPQQSPVKSLKPREKKPKSLRKVEAPVPVETPAEAVQEIVDGKRESNIGTPEFQKLMIAELDKAIPNAIDVAKKNVHIGSFKEEDFVRISIPGDGEFKIANVKEILEDVKKKVSRLHFKDREAPAKSIPPGNYAPMGNEIGSANTKEPWERTQAEYVDDVIRATKKNKHYGGLTESQAVMSAKNAARTNHEYYVKQAIAEGKPVPEEVKNEYPNLTSKQTTTETKKEFQPLSDKTLTKSEAQKIAKMTDAELEAYNEIQRVKNSAIVSRKVASDFNGRVFGTMTDPATGETLSLSLRPDNSVGGAYSVVRKNKEGRSASDRMQFGGNTPIEQVVKDYQEYLDLGENNNYKVSLNEAKEPKNLFKKPSLSADELELKRLEAKKYKTRGNKITIQRLKDKIAIDPTKWNEGDGVGWKVSSSQINRGYRIVSVNAKDKTAVIRSVADTGITMSGGNYDKLPNETVSLIDLVRDNKYNAQPKTLKKPEGVTLLGGNAKAAQANQAEAMQDINKGANYQFKHKEGDKVTDKENGKQYIVKSAYIENGEARYTVYPPGKKQSLGYHVWIKESDLKSPKSLKKPAKQGKGTEFQVSPETAKKLNTPVDLPKDPKFTEAVANTPHSKIVEDGLLIKVTRSQKQEQGESMSVRTGVFYQPLGSHNKYSYSGKNDYGGNVKIEGETLLRKPFFVKGATGGRAPQVAYDMVKGKKAYENMRHEVLRGVLGLRWDKSQSDKITETQALLEKYNDLDSSEAYDMAYEIVQNSKQGNTLAYAIQENIVAHAVRGEGYDSILGWTAKRDGTPFLSEVFDLRETSYPSRENPEGEIHPDYLKHEQYQTQGMVAPATEQWNREATDILSKAIKGVKVESLSHDEMVEMFGGNKRGAIRGNTIYINKDHAGRDTIFHEYGHAYVNYMEEQKTELWRKGAVLIQNTEYYRDSIRSGYGDPINEALVQAIGEKGAKIQGWKKKSEFKAWLNKVYTEAKVAFKRLFNIDLTLDEFTSKLAYEMRSGKPIMDVSGNKLEFGSQVDVAGAGPNEIEDARREWQEKGTESKYFKRWFGDSKVVDNNGKPLVVYHSTSEKFNSFDIKKGRSYSGILDYDLPGFYFTSEKAFSQDYGNITVDAYLCIKNPFIGDLWDYRKRNNLKTWKAVYDKLNKDGFDGAILSEGANNSEEEFIAFFPTQIKSATGNRGTFDPNNPDIRYQVEPDKTRKLFNESGAKTPHEFFSYLYDKEGLEFATREFRRFGEFKDKPAETPVSDRLKNLQAGFEGLNKSEPARPIQPSPKIVPEQPKPKREPVSPNIAQPQAKTVESKSVYLNNLIKRLEEHAQIDPEYPKMNLPEDAAKAIDFVSNNKTKAREVAVGYKKGPKDITDTAIRLAYLESAIIEAKESGDYTEAAKTANAVKLSGIRKGQEVAAYRGVVNENSIQHYVNKVIEARTELLTKKSKFTPKDKKKALTENISNQTETAKKVMDSNRLRIDEAQQLLDLLSC